METEIFRSLAEGLAPYLGSARPLDSGNGLRFTSETKGKATIYHTDIASGNHAEVAFEAKSMSRRLRMSEAEFKSFVGQLRSSTGRPTEPNQQFDWPRVGLDSHSHVAMITEAIQRRIQSNA